MLLNIQEPLNVHRNLKFYSLRNQLLGVDTIFAIQIISSVMTYGGMDHHHHPNFFLFCPIVQEN